MKNHPHRRLIGILLIFGGLLALFGCTAPKYSLHLDGGLESKKKHYKAGEEVTVTYSMIASDTDYRFSSDDVEMERDYDDKKGYVLRFIMPEHDVTITVDWNNTMTFDPDAWPYGPDSGNPRPDTDPDESVELAEGQWICPECRQINDGNYCSSCGTKKPD